MVQPLMLFAALSAQRSERLTEKTYNAQPIGAASYFLRGSVTLQIHSCNYTSQPEHLELKELLVSSSELSQ